MKNLIMLAGCILLMMLLVMSMTRPSTVEEGQVSTSLTLKNNPDDASKLGAAERLLETVISELGGLQRLLHHHLRKHMFPWRRHRLVRHLSHPHAPPSTEYHLGPRRALIMPPRPMLKERRAMLRRSDMRSLLPRTTQPTDGDRTRPKDDKHSLLRDGRVLWIDTIHLLRSGAKSHPMVGKSRRVSHPQKEEHPWRWRFRRSHDTCSRPRGTCRSQKGTWHPRIDTCSFLNDTWPLLTATPPCRKGTPRCRKDNNSRCQRGTWQCPKDSWLILTIDSVLLRPRDAERRHSTNGSPIVSTRRADRVQEPTTWAGWATPSHLLL